MLRMEPGGLRRPAEVRFSLCTWRTGQDGGVVHMGMGMGMGMCTRMHVHVHVRVRVRVRAHALMMAAGGWCKGGLGSRLKHGHQLELGSISVDLGQLDHRGPLQRSREDALVILHAEAHRRQPHLGGDGALEWPVRDRVAHGVTSAPEVQQAAADTVPDDDEPKPVSPLS